MFMLCIYGHKVQGVGVLGTCSCYAYMVTKCRGRSSRNMFMLCIYGHKVQG